MGAFGNQTRPQYTPQQNQQTNVFQNGMNAVQQGVNTFQNGANALQGGFNTINNGLNTFNNISGMIQGGFSSLMSPVNAVVSGVQGGVTAARQLYGLGKDIYGGISDLVNPGQAAAREAAEKQKLVDERNQMRNEEITDQDRRAHAQQYTMENAYGKVHWEYDADGTAHQVSEQDDYQKQLKNAASGMVDRIGSQDAVDNAVKANTDAQMEMYHRQNDEQNQEAIRKLSESLLARGISEDSPAYKAAMKNALNAQADAEANARNQAVSQGYQYGNQAYQNELSAFDRMNAFHDPSELYKEMAGANAYAQSAVQPAWQYSAGREDSRNQFAYQNAQLAQQNQQFYSGQAQETAMQNLRHAQDVETSKNKEEYDKYMKEWEYNYNYETDREKQEEMLVQKGYEANLEAQRLGLTHKQALEVKKEDQRNKEWEKGADNYYKSEDDYRAHYYNKERDTFQDQLKTSSDYRQEDIKHRELDWEQNISEKSEKQKQKYLKELKNLDRQLTSQELQEKKNIEDYLDKNKAKRNTDNDLKKAAVEQEYKTRNAAVEQGYNVTNTLEGQRNIEKSKRLEAELKKQEMIDQQINELAKLEKQQELEDKTLGTKATHKSAENIQMRDLEKQRMEQQKIIDSYLNTEKANQETTRDFRLQNFGRANKAEEQKFTKENKLLDQQFTRENEATQNIYKQSNMTLEQKNEIARLVEKERIDKAAATEHSKLTKEEATHKATIDTEMQNLMHKHGLKETDAKAIADIALAQARGVEDRLTGKKEQKYKQKNLILEQGFKKKNLKLENKLDLKKMDWENVYKESINNQLHYLGLEDKTADLESDMFKINEQGKVNKELQQDKALSEYRQSLADVENKNKMSRYDTDMKTEVMEKQLIADKEIEKVKHDNTLTQKEKDATIQSIRDSQQQLYTQSNKNLDSTLEGKRISAQNKADVAIESLRGQEGRLTETQRHNYGKVNRAEDQENAEKLKRLDASLDTGKLKMQQGFHVKNAAQEQSFTRTNKYLDAELKRGEITAEQKNALERLAKTHDYTSAENVQRHLFDSQTLSDKERLEEKSDIRKAGFKKEENVQLRGLESERMEEQKRIDEYKALQNSVRDATAASRTQRYDVEKLKKQREANEALENLRIIAESNKMERGHVLGKENRKEEHANLLETNRQKGNIDFAADTHKGQIEENRQTLLQGYNLDNLKQQQLNDLAKMGKTHEYTTAEARQKANIDEKAATHKNTLDVGMEGVKHGHNIRTLKEQERINTASEAAAHGYREAEATQKGNIDFAADTHKGEIQSTREKELAKLEQEYNLINKDKDFKNTERRDSQQQLYTQLNKNLDSNLEGKRITAQQKADLLLDQSRASEGRVSETQKHNYNKELAQLTHGYNKEMTQETGKETRKTNKELSTFDINRVNTEAKNKLLQDRALFTHENLKENLQAENRRVELGMQHTQEQHRDDVANQFTTKRDEALHGYKTKEDLAKFQQETQENINKYQHENFRDQSQYKHEDLTQEAIRKQEKEMEQLAFSHGIDTINENKEKEIQVNRNKAHDDLYSGETTRRNLLADQRQLNKETQEYQTAMKSAELNHDYDIKKKEFEVERYRIDQMHLSEREKSAELERVRREEEEYDKTILGKIRKVGRGVKNVIGWAADTTGEAAKVITNTGEALTGLGVGAVKGGAKGVYHAFRDINKMGQAYDEEEEQSALSKLASNQMSKQKEYEQRGEQDKNILKQSEDDTLNPLWNKAGGQYEGLKIDKSGGKGKHKIVKDPYYVPPPKFIPGYQKAAPKKKSFFRSKSPTPGFRTNYTSLYDNN